VRAGNERSEHTKVDEVAGPEWWSSGFGSPPSGGDGDSTSPVTRQARLGRCEMMLRRAAGVQALQNGGKRSGVSCEVQFIGARPGTDTRRVRPASNCSQNQWIRLFPDQISSFHFLIKPFA
jgi:hypothetical protein